MPKAGLGEVFVAHDEELHREEALKEIRGRYADEPNSRARFVFEAEITGGLEHPGIVPVYGLGSYAAPNCVSTSLVILDQQRFVMDNPKCYAGDLNDCSPKITGEHVTSNAILKVIAGNEPTIIARNVAFREPSTSARLPIKGLVANILCEHHNSLLSPFDSAGLDLVAAMGKIDSKMTDGNHSDETFTVNGDHLERWFLKTLIAGLYGNHFPLPDGVKYKGIRPSMEALCFLYRGVDFPKGHGLYLKQIPEGKPYATDYEQLKIAVHYEREIVFGLHAWFFNFEFLFANWNARESDLPDMSSWLYRPLAINFCSMAGGENRIQFQWKDGTADEMHLQHAGNFQGPQAQST